MNEREKELLIQKNKFLVGLITASIGAGCLFPPIWIGTVILVVVLVLNQK